MKNCAKKMSKNVDIELSDKNDPKLGVIFEKD